MSICINAPEIVASGSFLSQTGNLSETALYTPDSGGAYRITLAFSYEQALGTNPGAIIYWTDDVEAQSSGYPSGSPGASPVSFYSVSGESISISVGVGSGTWNLRWVIEAL